MDQPRLLTVKNVAERWSVSPSTVYALLANGILPHVRIGSGRGTIRISHEDAEAYEAKNKRDDEKTYSEHFA